MIKFKENASVIFTDSEGRLIDTFVIFDTDSTTGLTHINHENLRVPTDQLKLHTKSVGDFHMPLSDAFSFEMLRKLKVKYGVDDKLQRAKPTPVITEKPANNMYVLAKAS